MQITSVKWRSASGVCLSFAVVVLASIPLLFAYEYQCTKQVPNPIPPACGGSYTKCQDMLTWPPCPWLPNCVGEYPEYIPKDCVTSTDPKVWCINSAQDTICRRKKDCGWSLVEQKCVEYEDCQIIWDTPKVADTNCVPVE